MSGCGETNGLHRSSVDITNRSEGPMTLYVEPWGDEFELQPSEGLRIDVLAPTERAIPISYGGNSVTVEGWEGAVAEVWKGNERLN
jgi:hypothetical protein